MMARRKLAMMSRTGWCTIEKSKRHLDASLSFKVPLVFFRKLKRRREMLSVAGIKLAAFMRRIARTRSKYGSTASAIILVPTASTEANTRALNEYGKLNTTKGYQII